MTSPEALGSRNFRLVDASLNRIAEGLRYLEDVSRFLLDDASLTKRLKTLRHSIVTSDWHFQKTLLDARDAEDDIGAGLKVSAQDEIHDMLSSIVANARRVQEALRTLEEFSKVSKISKNLTSRRLEQARFDIYTIEKELCGKLLRQDAANRIDGIYSIIDSQALRGRDHVDVTRQIIRGGASVIQLRDKTLDHGKLLPVAQAMKQVCTENGVLFIINDYLDLALVVKADGLHVGQTDLPVSVVRKLVPIDMIVGCSVDTASEAKKAQAEGADYVAIGAIFPTPSKEAPIVGLKRLRQVKKAVSVPVVAIGGITLQNIGEVKSKGADAAAVISAVLGAHSPEKAVKQLIKKFEGNNG
jgi:thiamine-phosphate pyrophosphorylase